MRKYLLLMLPILFASLYIKTVLAESNEQLKEVVVVAPWEITSADPSKSGVIFQRMQLAETLVDVNDKGELIAGLAESWTNTDAKEWIFKLRPGVIFHDGTPLTAKEVVKSLTVALTKPSILNKANIEKIEVSGEDLVRITLSKSLQSFPAFLTHYTAIILADSSFNQQEVVNIIGTGPFKLASIEPPQSLSTVRFDQYWGKLAALTHIKYLATSRSESRALMAQSDDNYIVYNLDPASVSRLKNNSSLDLQSKSIARTIQLKMNVANTLFDELAEREILSDAINRVGLANMVLRIKDGAAWQILPLSFSDWQIDVHATSQPNNVQLKEKLQKLGYTLNQNGIFEKEGKPFKFTLRTFSDRPELPIIATALQDQWKQIGIDVTVSIGNFSEIPAGHQDGSLEMALYARNYGIIPDPIGVLLQDFAKQGNDWGVMNWQNSELDQALRALETENNPTQVKQLKQYISHIIYRERPIIPVVYYQQNAVVNKKLKGLRLDPFERSFYLNELSW